MELEKHTIKKLTEKSRAFSQISLDDDYIIKDNKPDIVKVIHTHGDIVVEETKVSNQAVWMNGKLDFRILYRSDDKYNKLDVVAGSIPFQEKVMVDDVEDSDSVKVHAQLEDLTVGIINSRKVAIRAVVGLYVTAENLSEIEIASGIVGGEGYEQKIEEQNFLMLMSAQRDVLRVHNEIKLPNAKPNIRRLLWYHVCLRNMEGNATDGRIMIQGEAYIGILYESQEDDQVQWLETTVPVSGEVTYSGEATPEVFWIRLDPDVMEVEVRNDYDGEARILGVDLSVNVDYKLWKEDKLDVIEDVYALDRNVLPKKEKSVFPQFLMKNIAKVRVSEQFKIESNQEKILQICSYESAVSIDRYTLEDNGIRFEGILKVHVIYFTADDNLPIAHLEAVLPFEQVVEIDGMTEDTWYDYDTGLDMLQVNLLDNSEYEIKAVLRISVLAFEECEIMHISGVEEQPLDMEKLMNQPGLVGYVVQEQEQLWDIARKNHTTMQKIMDTNGLKTEKIAQGTKLVIVKEIITC